MNNQMYWHSECQGCDCYGIECERSCEFSELEGFCPHFVPREDNEDFRTEDPGE